MIVQNSSHFCKFIGYICRRGPVDHGQGVLHAKISIYCQLGNGKLAQIFIHAVQLKHWEYLH